jgi:hypothetical protein
MKTECNICDTIQAALVFFGPLSTTDIRRKLAQREIRLGLNAARAHLEELVENKKYESPRKVMAGYMQKIKIRFKTWYWGNFIYSGSKMDGSIVTLETSGFEIYDEEKHGWKNSEEFKNGRLEPFGKGEVNASN